MNSDVKRALAWMRYPIADRSCAGAKSLYSRECSKCDVRATDVGDYCAEHYLGLPGCRECGMPVYRRGHRVAKTVFDVLCRACLCADDPVYLAVEKQLAYQGRSSYAAIEGQTR